MSAAIDQMVADLVAKVGNAVGAMDSAVVYIKGVPGLLAAAVAEAQANGATAAELEPLTTLGTTLQTKSDEIVAALSTQPAQGRR